MSHEDALKRAKERIASSPYPSTPKLELPTDALSDRELEIVTGVSYGLTDQMVGEIYGISTHTVKNHVRRIQQKLRAKNRAHASCEAIRKGLIR